MARIARLSRRLLWAAVLLSSAVFADVPATLNYQGTLADSTGQPINGSKTITFSLYTAATGGTAFWSETQTLTLKDGKLSVVLGANAAKPIDPKKFTGETYIGVKVATDAEMPRQKFTSVAYAFKAADAIPKGVVVMWSGATTAVPSGWALCDGSNGTPDLRDRFVVGAGSGYASGNTGGVNSIDISHSHAIAAESPGTSGVGDHQHSFSGTTTTNNNTDQRSKTDDLRDTAGSQHTHNFAGDTSAAGAHSHTVNAHSHGGATGAAGSTALENRPPYYALAFIIKL